MSLKQLVQTETALVASIRNAATVANTVGNGALNDALAELAAALRNAQERLAAHVTAFNVLIGDATDAYADAAADINIDVAAAQTAKIEQIANATSTIAQETPEDTDGVPVNETPPTRSYAALPPLVADMLRIAREVDEEANAISPFNRIQANGNGVH